MNSVITLISLGLSIVTVEAASVVKNVPGQNSAPRQSENNFPNLKRNPYDPCGPNSYANPRKTTIPKEANLPPSAKERSHKTKELLEAFAAKCPGLKSAFDRTTFLKITLRHDATYDMIEQGITNLADVTLASDPIPHMLCQDFETYPILLLRMDSWLPYLTNLQDIAIQKTLFEIVKNTPNIHASLRTMLKDGHGGSEEARELRQILSTLAVPIQELYVPLVARYLAQLKPKVFLQYVASTLTLFQGGEISEPVLKGYRDEFYDENAALVKSGNIDEIGRKLSNFIRVRESRAQTSSSSNASPPDRMVFE
jgi:hypothetical protein